MSVDNTINELSNTLSELGRLVNHINTQIGGITGRINITLDNFDQSVAKVALDASSVTGQVGDTVSAVPNSWVFYLLFITLIVVFILLSIVLFLNLITKMHAIYVIIKGKETEKVPIVDDNSYSDNNPQSTQYYNSNIQQGYGGAPIRSQKPAQVALPMDTYEPPRRPMHSDYNRSRDGSYITEDQLPIPSTRSYQRKPHEDNTRGGVYNLETGMTSYGARSQEV